LAVRFCELKFQSACRNSGSENRTGKSACATKIFS
jgi:hypothetical protein